jgi:dTDP-4-amino-4,6-dideoxygalactose transaminase
LQVPFNDLRRGAAELGPQLADAARDVIDSGWYVLGERVRAFEGEFAAWLGTKHCSGVASGTDAIEVALRALELEPGSEVITQANTCVPTVAGIERAGLTPVLCDVDPESATIDPESLRAAVTPRTRAIVPVHLYGQPGDMAAVMHLARDAGLRVVEDCAQAHGATFDGHMAGTIGDLGAFSFYPTKNLGAIGDGGAVVTSDDRLAERLGLVRQYGQSDRYNHVARGVNSRLDELQAALLSVKLPHLNSWNQRRAEIAARYTQALERSDAQPLAQLPDRRHVFHLYVVRSPERDALQQRLKDEGIGTLIHYPRPIHGHPPYKQLGDGPVPLTNSVRLAGEILSLPIYPELTDAEVDSVCAALAR